GADAEERHEPQIDAAGEADHDFEHEGERRVETDPGHHADPVIVGRRQRAPDGHRAEDPGHPPLPAGRGHAQSFPRSATFSPRSPIGRKTSTTIRITNATTSL